MALSQVFNSFAGGSEMDNRAFVKCLKDTGIFDKSMTSNDADLIFAKYKPKGGRKIDLAGFNSALADVAAKKKMTAAQIEEKMAGSAGPTYAGTQGGSGATGPERFFYDKNSYTGTHQQGGPTTMGSGANAGGYADLSGLINRDVVQDDAMNRKAGRAQGVEGVAGTPAPATGGLAVPNARGQGARSKSPSADAARSKSPQPKAASPRPGSAQGNAAAPKPAAKAGALRGPERFFYDQSSYTGVHKEGGPTTVDKGRTQYSDLSQMTRDGVNNRTQC